MLLKLISKKSETSGVITWTFESYAPLFPIAGQYFHYVLPHADSDDRGTERWFTNSAAPIEGHVQITARFDAANGSSFKRALNELEPGQTIEADGPEGSFTVEDFSKNYIFVAGGIGITPFRSILVEAKLRKLPLNANVLYANRSNDIAFKEELSDIAANNPDITINYIVEPDRVDADIIKDYVDQTTDPMVYISGPEPMVKSLAEDLQNKGVDPGIIKIDDFPGYEAI